MHAALHLAPVPVRNPDGFHRILYGATRHYVLFDRYGTQLTVKGKDVPRVVHHLEQLENQMDPAVIGTARLTYDLAMGTFHFDNKKAKDLPDETLDALEDLNGAMAGVEFGTLIKDRTALQDTQSPNERLRADEPEPEDVDAQVRDLERGGSYEHITHTLGDDVPKNLYSTLKTKDLVLVTFYDSATKAYSGAVIDNIHKRAYRYDPMGTHDKRAKKALKKIEKQTRPFFSSAVEITKNAHAHTTDVKETAVRVSEFFSRALADPQNLDLSTFLDFEEVSIETVRDNLDERTT